MDTEKNTNHNSLAFLVYTTLAGSLWFIYYGMTQLIIVGMRYFIFDPTGTTWLYQRGFFSATLSDVAAMLLLGGGLFWLFRVQEVRAFKTSSLSLDGRVRIWLLRLMMVATGISVVVDLWFILRAVLRGEGALDETLYTLTTLIVASGILVFLARSTRGAPSPQRPLKSPGDAAVVCGALLATGVCIWMAPPSLMKILRADHETLKALTSTQQGIDEWVTQTNALPRALDEAAQKILTRHSTVSGLGDNLEEINKKVAYAVVSKNQYQLCATFERSSKEFTLLGLWRSAKDPFLRFTPGKNCKIITVTLSPAPPSS